MITALLFASTLAFAPSQEPQTYAEALRCESVLIVGTVMMDEIAKAEGGDAVAMVPILVQMAQRATADREAAAAREKIDPSTSEPALMAEIELNSDTASDEYGRRFEICARTYGEGLLTVS